MSLLFLFYSIFIDLNETNYLTMYLSDLAKMFRIERYRRTNWEDRSYIRFAGIQYTYPRPVPAGTGRAGICFTGMCRIELQVRARALYRTVS